jgi:hypothetical protein
MTEFVSNRVMVPSWERLLPFLLTQRMTLFLLSGGMMGSMTATETCFSNTDSNLFLEHPSRKTGSVVSGFGVGV